MNDRFEHELSELLDGRLPSGRRERLIEQLDTDENAALLFDEMEQAQELARSLTVHGIGPTFSETLWQRIRSGEGTPEAVFREPLSIWTKARYIATGAVAAAAVLVAFSVLTRPDRGPGQTPPIDRTDVDRTEVANAPTPNRLRPRAAAPDRLDAPFLNAVQIAPESIAYAGQIGCADAVSALQTRGHDVERRLEQTDAREVFVDLEPFVVRARGSAHLIRWMQEGKMVELPGEMDTALALAERALRRMDLANTSNDRAQLRFAVQDLMELEVDGLRREFYTICCKPQAEFRSLLREQVLRHADVRSALKIQIVDLGAGAQTIQLHHVGEPLGNGMLIFGGGSASGFGSAFRIPGGGSQQVEVRVEVEHEELHSSPRRR